MGLPVTGAGVGVGVAGGGGVVGGVGVGGVVGGVGVGGAVGGVGVGAGVVGGGVPPAMADVRGVLQGVPMLELPLEKLPHSATPQKPEGGQGEPCRRSGAASAPGASW